MSKDYTHMINKEIRSISGGYVIDNEHKIEIDGKEVLYAVGNALMDSACCGTFGCRYALVPGYVVRWKHKVNGEGIPISEVEPITNSHVKDQLTKHITGKEGVTQIQFW
jgi:hypothetical protein